MSRKSYVWIEGELREKVTHNCAIVGSQYYYCIAGRWEPAGQTSPGEAPMIMPDIQPYTSMIDGSTITSRSRHREHLRAHGCIEVGDQKLPPPRLQDTATRGLREELIARING